MTGNQEIFQTAMNQGHSAAWDQLWDKAVQYYRMALEEFPENTSTLSNLGLALFELENFEQSLLVYQKVLNISPDDPIAHDKIASIHERLGRLPEAIKSFSKAADQYLKNKEVEKAIDCWTRIIRLKPDHLMARTRLAMVYERQGKKIEAVNEYLATASIMQRSGKTPRAIQIVEYCLQLQSDHQTAINALAQIRSNQLLPMPARPPESISRTRAPQVKETPNPAESEDDLNNPIEEARQNALVSLAGLLFDQADDEETKVDINKRGLSSIAHGTGSKSLDKVKDGKVFLYLGQAIDAQTRGDNDQTMVELERTMRSGLDHPAVSFLMGLIQSNQDPKKAIKHLQQSFRHPDFALGSYLLLGLNYIKLEDYREAAIAYLQALSIADCETSPPEQVDAVRQSYEPIIETQSQGEDPERFKALCLNIDVQINRSDWRKYITTVRNQMSNDQGDYVGMPIAEFLLETGTSQVVEAMARVKELADQNNFYGAMEEAFYSIDLAPTYLPLHTQIGELLLQQGKTQEAVTKFILVATLYNLRGEAAQGIRLLERVTKMAPMDLKIRNQMVEMLINQGEQKPAVEQLVKIADIHYQLAELEKARQTYALAIKLIQHSKGERALLVDMLYKKADIDLQKLDLRQAMQTFEQIRTIEPEDFKARIHLIDLKFRLGQDEVAINEMDGFIALLNKNGKQQKIVEFLQQLLNDIPDKLEIRKRLADLYIHLGNISEAVKELDVIADSLLNMGNKDAALRVLGSIISLNPTNVSAYQQAYNELTQ